MQYSLVILIWIYRMYWLSTLESIMIWNFLDNHYFELPFWQLRCTSFVQCFNFQYMTDILKNFMGRKIMCYIFSFVFYELALLKKIVVFNLQPVQKLYSLNVPLRLFQRPNRLFPFMLEIFWTVFVQASQFGSSPYRYTETTLAAVFENGPGYCERAI